MKKFSIREATSFGWATFKKNWKFLMTVVVAVSAIEFAPVIFNFLISRYGGNEELFIGLVLSSIYLRIIFAVISIILSIGMIKIYLLIEQGQPANFSDLYKNSTFFFKYLFASIIYNLIVFLGFLALIIPGIIFSIRLSFWQYAMLDKNLGPISALKESWGITKGSVLNLIGFKFVQLLVSLVGILALGIGILVSGSVSNLAEVFVYRKLSSSKEIRSFESGESQVPLESLGRR